MPTIKRLTKKNILKKNDLKKIFKIGIWGLGLVGKSVLEYYAKNIRSKTETCKSNKSKSQTLKSINFANKNIINKIEIFDKRLLTDEEKFLVMQSQAGVSATESPEQFIEMQNIVIPSPGIDLRNYSKYKDKFKSELSFFASEWKKKSIAITGTLGKTSLVTILNSVLNQEKNNSILGGNVGIPLLNLLDKQKEAKYCILELSSFQLELSHNFAPDIAIITNFYPNHLDRHTSSHEYFAAKASLLTNQNNKQTSILPLSLASSIRKYLINHNRPLIFFTTENITSEDLKNLEVQNILKPLDIVYSFVNLKICKFSAQSISNLSFDIDQAFFKDLHKENKLILAIIFDVLKINPNLNNISYQQPQHRCELITNHNNIKFYNDSKSTVIEATIAALDKIYLSFQNPEKSNVVLFLGGTSKGVDRFSKLQSLTKFPLKKIYCFGAESQQLLLQFKKYTKQSASDPENFKNISTASVEAHETLEQAFTSCIKYLSLQNETEQNKAILFSPGGASFDLFCNYIDRGNKFKELVTNYINSYK